MEQVFGLVGEFVKAFCGVEQSEGGMEVGGERRRVVVDHSEGHEMSHLLGGRVCQETEAEGYGPLEHLAHEFEELSLEGEVCECEEEESEEVEEADYCEGPIGCM